MNDHDPETFGPVIANRKRHNNDLDAKRFAPTIRPTYVLQSLPARRRPRLRETTC